MVIDICNVSKAYRIYPQPLDRFKQSFAWGRKQYYREFMALTDVSFQVHRGEMIGIIGRNGSGKSTLLQIIAGTLTPTSGHVRMTGRVAALLELGSGFDLEATGRENIFMNGSVLGLSRDEIVKRYDEMVAFADIGEFVDQPVKTYSSGMIVRLAFAVAAHVEAEILIVDEALAVGDAAFQRKCIRRLEKFLADGGTVLLVTHDAETVVRLCHRAIMLHEGHVLAHGDSKPVTDAYHQLIFGTASQQQRLIQALRNVRGSADLLVLDFEAGKDRHPSDGTDTGCVDEEGPAEFSPATPAPVEHRYGTGGASIENPQLVDARGNRAAVATAGELYYWQYRVTFHRTVHGVRFGMAIKTVDGVMVAGISNGWDGREAPCPLQGATHEVRFEIRLNLAPGVYFFNAGVSGLEEEELNYLDRRVDVAMVQVVAPEHQGLAGLAYLNHEFISRPVSCETRHGAATRHSAGD